jgi:hypothetical protein
MSGSSQYTEEIVFFAEQEVTRPSYDQVPMHIDSDDDDNDRKRHAVDDLDDDL